MDEQVVESVQKGGHTAMTFLIMFIIVPFVIVHFISSFIPYGEIVYFALLLLILVSVWLIIFRRASAITAASQ